MIRIYGSKISYFTGKLETYLRYRGIAYASLPLYVHGERVKASVGTTQMPAVELEDGRWMSDSTPIIRHFEEERGNDPNAAQAPSIFPDDRALRFLALLIEDYADEWLWRPAMHYRWSYAHDREFASSFLVDEQISHIKRPRFLKRRLIQRRQRGGFVIGDGVTDSTREHVEGGYFRALENMTRLLESRRFLLGDVPSIADIGLMGPMLRHFGQDPTPAEWMRERAPAVYAWVGRMWNARADSQTPGWIPARSEELRPMLREICETHLVQLVANAAAFDAGRPADGRTKARRFDAQIQGCAYRDLPISRYRVWCLEELRREFGDLDPTDAERVRSMLPHPEAEILWCDDFETRSGYDPERLAPFNRAINVYGDGVPR